MFMDINLSFFFVVGTLSLGNNGLASQPIGTQIKVVKKKPSEHRHGHEKAILNLKRNENLELKEIKDDGTRVDELTEIRKESCRSPEDSAESKEEMKDRIDDIDENMIFSDDDCDEVKIVEDIVDIIHPRNYQDDKINTFYVKENKILDTNRLWNNQSSSNSNSTELSKGRKDHFENLSVNGSSSSGKSYRKKLEDQNIATILDTIIHNKLPETVIIGHKISAPNDFAEIVGYGIDELENCNIPKIIKRIGKDYQANLEDSLPLSSLCSSSISPIDYQVNLITLFLVYFLKWYY